MNSPLPTPASKARRLADLDNLRTLIASLPTATPCIDCAFFSPDTGWCGHWKATVPIEAREVGCEHWQEGVPF